MIIQNNISALHVRNKLNVNQKEKAKIGEKLSSGYRINRAADDAAGLSISETMRAQIRGLEQNQLNVNDGISLIQTADGAMAEMTDILQRIRELTVQARNCTNTTIDKYAMQEEINGLRTEIERLSEDTEFNTRKILKGIHGNISTYPSGYMPSWVNMPAGGLVVNNPNVNPGTKQDVTKPLPGSGNPPGGNYWTESLGNNASAVIDFGNIGVPDIETNLKELLGTGFYSTCCTCSREYVIAFSDSNSLPGNVSGVQTVININDLITASQNNTMNAAQISEALVDRIIARGNSSHFTGYVKNDGNPSQLVVYDWRDNQVPGSSYGKVVDHITYIREEKDIMLQVGPNSEQSLEIVLPKIDLYALRLQYGWDDYYGVIDTTKTITTYPDIQYGYDPVTGERVVISWGQPVTTTQTIPGNGTLNDVDHAIDYVTAARSRMGAYQNALEHIYNNVSNTGENLQKAESIIRDADMAELMVYFSTHDILLEAGNSMLAQANSSPQRILELLK